MMSEYVFTLHTVRLADRIKTQPGMMELIRAKVEQLRAEGFFDRFPAPVQEGENPYEEAHPDRAVPA